MPARGMAQPGSALRSGRRGPQFESAYPDEQSRAASRAAPPVVLGDALRLALLRDRAFAGVDHPAGPRPCAPATHPAAPTAGTLAAGRDWWGRGLLGCRAECSWVCHNARCLRGAAACAVRGLACAPRRAAARDRLADPVADRLASPNHWVDATSRRPADCARGRLAGTTDRVDCAACSLDRWGSRRDGGRRLAGVDDPSSAGRHGARDGGASAWTTGVAAVRDARGLNGLGRRLPCCTRWGDRGLTRARDGCGDVRHGNHGPLAGAAL